jgi:TPR repeat protein
VRGGLDNSAALDWYRKAAEQGDPMAQYRLGVMYAKGWGVPQDDTAAVSWYRKAADQGDVPAPTRTSRGQREPDQAAQGTVGVGSLLVRLNANKPSC